MNIGVGKLLGKGSRSWRQCSPNLELNLALRGVYFLLVY